MAKDRVAVCEYYICVGECAKGRDADYDGYCQKCSKYKPRSKVKKYNGKKEKIEKIREKEAYEDM